MAKVVKKQYRPLSETWADWAVVLIIISDSSSLTKSHVYRFLSPLQYLNPKQNFKTKYLSWKVKFSVQGFKPKRSGWKYQTNPLRYAAPSTSKLTYLRICHPKKFFMTLWHFAQMMDFEKQILTLTQTLESSEEQVCEWVRAGVVVSVRE